MNWRGRETSGCIYLPLPRLVPTPSSSCYLSPSLSLSLCMYNFITISWKGKRKDDLMTMTNMNFLFHKKWREVIIRKGVKLMILNRSLLSLSLPSLSDEVRSTNVAFIFIVSWFIHVHSLWQPFNFCVIITWSTFNRNAGVCTKFVLVSECECWTGIVCSFIHYSLSPSLSLPLSLFHLWFKAACVWNEGCIDP